MKKRVLTNVVCFIAGVLTAGVLIFSAMDSIMLMEDPSEHSFGDTVDLFRWRVEEAGWSVLTTHDMQAVLARHGHSVRPVKVFELCSSGYSAEILSLSDERIVSSLMPCRVAVYEKDDGVTYISRMNSSLMAVPFGGVIKKVMSAASAETEDIISGALR